MMLLWKAIGMLLSLMGVTELSVQCTYKQSTPSLVQDMVTKYSVSILKQPLAMSVAKLDSKPVPSLAVRPSESHSSAHSDHDDGAQEESMQAAMKAVKTCHVGCGKDAACHAECPKPWARLEEQCIAAEPVMPCHQACGRNPWCHSRCPVPENDALKKKLSERTKCQESCRQDDLACFRQCPHPLLETMYKCHILRGILSCHHQCAPGDCACHHTCPNMQSLWAPGISAPFHHAPPFMEHHDHHHHGEVAGGPHNWHADHHHRGEAAEGPRDWHHDHRHGEDAEEPHAWHHGHHHHEEPAEGPHDWHHHHHHEEGEEGPHDWHHPHHHGDHHHHHGEGEEEHHFEGEHRPNPVLAELKAEMQQAKACHSRCGHCRGCHARCPQPWAGLVMQCDALQPVWACHKACAASHGGAACHAQCPRPSSAKWARLLEEASACHSACKEGDIGCHSQCPRPFAAIARKCDLLGEKLACHNRCRVEAEGASCHHGCTKMMDVYGYAAAATFATAAGDAAVHATASADPFHV